MPRSVAMCRRLFVAAANHILLPAPGFYSQSQSTVATSEVGQALADVVPAAAAAGLRISQTLRNSPSVLKSISICLWYARGPEESRLRITG